jgi:hypothetical protein
MVPKFNAHIKFTSYKFINLALEQMNGNNNSSSIFIF